MDGHDNELIRAKLSSTNCQSISIAPGMLEKLCEGWGSDFCLQCPFTDLIPIKCQMGVQQEDESVLCCKCELVCPCNRSLCYDKVLTEILRFESSKVMAKILP